VSQFANSPQQRLTKHAQDTADQVVEAVQDAFSRPGIMDESMAPRRGTEPQAQPEGDPFGEANVSLPVGSPPLLDGVRQTLAQAASAMQAPTVSPEMAESSPRLTLRLEQAAEIFAHSLHDVQEYARRLCEVYGGRFTAESACWLPGGEGFARVRAAAGLGQPPSPDAYSLDLEAGMQLYFSAQTGERAEVVLGARLNRVKIERLQTEIASFPFLEIHPDSFGGLGSAAVEVKPEGHDIEVNIGGHKGRVTLVPPTAERPGMILADAEVFGLLAREEAKFGGMLGKAADKWAQSVGAVYLEHRSIINGERGWILAARFERGSTEEYARWQAGIDHECEHARGGSELAAYRAQQESLERSGAIVNHHSDEQILAWIESRPLYQGASAFLAMLEKEGLDHHGPWMKTTLDAIDTCRDLYRRAKLFLSGGPIIPLPEGFRGDYAARA
jgi:hypothetical protein